MSAIAWYDEKKENVARAVFATCDHIRSEQYTARRMMLHHLDMYSDGNPAGLGQRAVPRAISQFFRGQPVGNLPGSYFNMARAVCDTACSMVAQQPPLPIYVTSGTDLKIARKAEKKTKVLQSQVNALRKGVFTEAFDFCVQTGTGVVHAFIGEDGLPEYEAVNPLEILVDHLDGLYRKPRSVHRYKYMSKQAAKEQWPGNDDLIMRSGCSSMDVIASYLMPVGSTQDEMVEVIESWAITRGKSKGRRTVSVTAGSLVDETYDSREFPLAFCRYRVRPFGFWGAGLIESVRPNQERVNQLIKKVARGQDLGSNLYIFSPEDDGGNAVNPNFITTKVATIIPFKSELGTPMLAKWDGTMVDLQQQIDLEFERVLRVEGISDQQLSGEGAGRGLSSGVAVRAADDVQSRRLFHPTERFEDMCLEASKLVERLNDQIAENNNAYAPRGFLSDAGVNFLVSSAWKELEIPEGQSFLNMMKMNALPTTPQGKWAAVQEWIQAGFIQKPAAIKLLQFPALDEFASLDTAAFDLVIKQICDLLDGIPTLPLPRQSMQLVLTIGTQAWNRMMLMNPEPEVIDAFEEYLDSAKAWADKAAADQQVAAQPPMPAEGAAPAPAGGLAATDLTTQVPAAAA